MLDIGQIFQTINWALQRGLAYRWGCISGNVRGIRTTLLYKDRTLLSHQESTPTPSQLSVYSHLMSLLQSWRWRSERSCPLCAISIPLFWPWGELGIGKNQGDPGPRESYFTKPLWLPLYLGDSETQMGVFCAAGAHEWEWRVKMLRRGEGACPA